MSEMSGLNLAERMNLFDDWLLTGEGYMSILLYKHSILVLVGKIELSVHRYFEL